MTLKVQDAGLDVKLSAIKDAFNGTPIKIHTFSNIVTITNASVLGDFTENTYAGYAAQSVSGWTAPTVTAHVGDIDALPNTFTRSTTGSPQNVYGYYVTNAASSQLYWAENDPLGPRVMANAGDTITITLRLTDQSL